MLVKILDADVDFVEALRAATGGKSAAKAYSIASSEYMGLRSTVREQQLEIATLRMKLEAASVVIERARFAAAALVESAGQKDLFS